DLRAELWASLFHNLVVACRTDEAVRLAPSARDGVYTSKTGAGKFAFGFAHSALEYELSHFDESLELLDAAERGEVPGDEDTRARLAQHYRWWILSLLGRFARGR